MLDLSLKIHIVSLLLLALVVVVNFFIVTKTENFILMVRRLRFTAPMYHLLIGSLVFTAMVMMAYGHIGFKSRIIVMIAAALVLFIMEIRNYKRMRIIGSKEIELQERFKRAARKLYLSELLVILVVSLVSVWG